MPKEEMYFVLLENTVDATKRMEKAMTEYQCSNSFNYAKMMITAVILKPHSTPIESVPGEATERSQKYCYRRKRIGWTIYSRRKLPG